MEAQDSTAIHWLKDNFWILLAVLIIIVSTSLGLIMYCTCRWLLTKGKTLKIAKTLKQNQRAEEKMYENVVSQSPVQLPPLPPRGLLSSKDTFPQETPNQMPATYSSVSKNREKTVSIPSYIEPEDDYDDVEITTNIANNNFETTVSSFWQVEEGAHNLF